MANDIFIDMDGLMASLKNEFQLGLLRSFCKDEQQKKDITAMIGSFTKHGIDVETAIDILTEIIAYLKDREV